MNREKWGIIINSGITYIDLYDNIWYGNHKRSLQTSVVGQIIKEVEMGTYKIKVVENIGDYSERTFGSPDTVLQVQDGILKDINGKEWNELANIEEVNKKLYYFEILYKTKFKLIKNHTKF